MDDIENEIKSEQQEEVAKVSGKPVEKQFAVETQNVMSKTNSGLVQEIELKNYNNQQYMGNIYIGDFHQEIPVLFDTGSPLVYVLTDQCGEELCP